MGKIQSNIGIITGVPIGDTVDSLMALASKPRDMIAERTEVIKEEQVAVLELSAYLTSVKYVADNLGKAELFEKCEAASSNEALLSTTVDGQPPKGTYQYTPVQTVQSQQMLSGGFRDDTEALGGGAIRFRYGPHVQRSASLELFGGGEGVSRGQIRITDRSGTSAQINLSVAQTVDDVLDAINSNTVINVSAVADGDRIRLVDNTGQAVSNLKVQEVGGGRTAASLGLDGVNVASTTAEGRDMLGLYEDLDLNDLNDGNGVMVSSALKDIDFVLRDGTTGAIDFAPLVGGSSEVVEEMTLGDMIDVINAAAPGKLQAQIAPDGDRLVVNDLTTGDGAFTLTAFGMSEALEDLGLDGEAVDGTIVGRRILGGARSVLLSSLNGGRGFGELGLIELNDRSGATDTIDLASAETLDDVVQAINSADVEITAQVNRAKNGIDLIDTSGASAGNLIVASADEKDTAEKLGLAVDVDSDRVGTGEMHLQIVSHNTLLADYNGGAGVAMGTMQFQDSSGYRAILDLVRDDVETIGDAILAINRLGIDVQAEINETGDGIRLVDLGDGTRTFKVMADKTNAAADLHLLGEVQVVEIDGEQTSLIDGSTTQVITLEEDESLEDLRRKINEAGVGVTASTFVDGSSRPYRLSLISDRPGEDGALVVDTSGIGFSLEETVEAQDALLVFGDVNASSSNVLVTSSTNTFKSVLRGATLTIEQASMTPVTITVGTSDADLVASVSTMVDNFNQFRDRFDELTYYDEVTETKSLLSSDATALRLDTELSYFFSGRFFGVGAIQSFAEVGITIDAEGALDFDETRLRERFAQDPDAVKEFFTNEDVGVAKRCSELLEQLSGQDTSLLAQRFKSLGDKIDRNEERINFLNERLERERDRLLMNFYRMEIAIGKLQNNMSALDSFQIIPPLSAGGDG